MKAVSFPTFEDWSFTGKRKKGSHEAKIYQITLRTDRQMVLLIAILNIY